MKDEYPTECKALYRIEAHLARIADAQALAVLERCYDSGVFNPSAETAENLIKLSHKVYKDTFDK